MIPELSVVFPVYNEEAILKNNLLQTVQTLDQAAIDFEIILVDDGSHDNTSAITASMARQDSRLHLWTLVKNQGKGGALKEGVSHSRGRIVLFSDMDLSVSFQELPAFLKALNRGCDLAIGSRKAPGARVLVHQTILREVLGRGFASLSRFILDLDVSDFTCGFKAFKGSVAKDLFSRLTLLDWSFDAELLFLSDRLGYRRVEIPVTWSNREETRVRLRKDLLNSFWGLLKIRWRHRRLRA
ncbi:MAG: glycosyltransferase [Deltaproteobacteria bacterium]|nr:glycosyltransferase [Deltaproteobacteria bacterium]